MECNFFSFIKRKHRLLLYLFMLVAGIHFFYGDSTSHLHIKDNKTGGSYNDNKQIPLNKNLPIIYIVTPTYERLEQIPELTRLGQTLKLVPRVHWIVAEDKESNNTNVIRLLQHLQIPFTYLLSPMPKEYRNRLIKPKGVANRNSGMQWVLINAEEGVLYFADDDNTYDARIFTEMRHTKKVTMWPVGLVTNFGLSTPVLKEGRFQQWYDGWIADRKFPVDMAGFAVAVNFLKKFKKDQLIMPYKPGYEEDGFLKKLNISFSDIEFKADNCTKVYVWHTKSVRNKPVSRKILHSNFDNTNLKLLRKYILL